MCKNVYLLDIAAYSYLKQLKDLCYNNSDNTDVN